MSTCARVRFAQPLAQATGSRSISSIVAACAGDYCQAIRCKNLHVAAPLVDVRPDASRREERSAAASCIRVCLHVIYRANSGTSTHNDRNCALRCHTSTCLLEACRRPATVVVLHQHRQFCNSKLQRPLHTCTNCDYVLHVTDSAESYKSNVGVLCLR